MGYHDFEIQFDDNVTTDGNIKLYIDHNLDKESKIESIGFGDINI